MRVLMLSWRYLDHPQAGGAEVVTHQVLRRFAAAGMEVTCFTAAHPGATAEETIDGVRIIRRGRQWTVHVHAWRWLRGRTAEFDRIVDQVNTIPFFTPLYTPSEGRRLLIWQLARGYWFRQTQGAFRLVAPLGYLAEPWYLRAYRQTPAITISASSADDLRRLGLGQRGLTVIPLALPFAPARELPAKNGPLRLVVVGRLTPAKYVDEAIRAFDEVQRSVPEARLDVVGSGDERYACRMKAMVAHLGLVGVTFHGRVDEEAKIALLRQAHVHVFCSHREGWGLTVTEAAAMGTPTVGYDAPGVRDSIAEDRLIAPLGDVGAVARAALELYEDRSEYDLLREAGWRRTQELSYDRTASAVAEALEIPWRTAR